MTCIHGGGPRKTNIGQHSSIGWLRHRYRLTVAMLEFIRTYLKQCPASCNWSASQLTVPCTLHPLSSVSCPQAPTDKRPWEGTHTNIQRLVAFNTHTVHVAAAHVLPTLHPLVPPRGDTHTRVHAHDRLPLGVMCIIMPLAHMGHVTAVCTHLVPGMPAHRQRCTRWTTEKHLVPAYAGWLPTTAACCHWRQSVTAGQIDDGWG
jgi:hypothetical protein